MTESSGASLTGDTTLDLPEFDAPPADPILLLQDWIDAATERRVREHLAVTLSTSDTEGDVTSRVVLLKGLQDRELVFTSHRSSGKGRQLAQNARAAVTFYWRETLQQVNVSGVTRATSGAESDELFAGRSDEAKAATVVSRQSEPLLDEKDLRRRAGAAVHGDAPLVRPEHWGGYRLAPDRIEFWYGSPDRLHRRLLYRLEGSSWFSLRLQP